VRGKEQLALGNQKEMGSHFNRIQQLRMALPSSLSLSHAAQPWVILKSLSLTNKAVFGKNMNISSPIST
jgi:hypothetical protein